MKKSYIVEFIGTFFLVATIGFTIKQDAPLAPLAIGAILMTMIFAGGHISGGHYNPAVTLAVWWRGRCTTADAPFYVVAQVLGASAAAALVNFVLTESPIAPVKETWPKIMPAFLVEFAFTFALAYVVLNVATAKGTATNSFYGLAIGFTVTAGAVAVGGISGGAFNPAVAVGAALLGLLSPSIIWLHILADFAGGALAAVTFRALNPEDV